MITAQDIRDVKFSKSLGGYKTSEVDMFLDDCADTVEALAAANSENERKMQVLAESIVEYRDREDSIRTALLSAQRMSDTVIAEANDKAADIVKAAEEEAAQVKAKAEETIAAELAELKRIKSEVAAFKARLFATYREHLTLIGILDGEEEADECGVAPCDDEPQEEVVVQEETATESAVAADEQPQDVMDAVGLDFSAFELQDDE